MTQKNTERHFNPEESGRMQSITREPLCITNIWPDTHILNLVINASEAMNPVRKGPRELSVSSEKLTVLVGHDADRVQTLLSLEDVRAGAGLSYPPFDCPRSRRTALGEGELSHRCPNSIHVAD